MNLNDAWRQFMATGNPGDYVSYKSAERSAENKAGNGLETVNSRKKRKKANASFNRRSGH